MLMNLVNYFNTHVKSHINNEKGQGMVEYGLIIAVVAILAITAFTGLGNAIIAKINAIVTSLNGA